MKRTEFTLKYRLVENELKLHDVDSSWPNGGEVTETGTPEEKSIGDRGGSF